MWSSSGRHGHGQSATPATAGPGGLELRPFRGVRFNVPDLAAVTSPPYDLIGPDGARALRDAHPNNVVRLILPGQDYELAHRTLMSWLSSGVLTVDEPPGLYVYEQRSPRVFQRGLIGAVGLTDPADKIVLPHEHTMPGPVADRLELMDATAANLEPIYLLYEGGGPASRAVESAAEARPLLEVTTPDGIRHRLWTITSADTQAEIAADLRSRQALIADGHHRYATYRALQARRNDSGHGPGPWDAGLALLVDSVSYPPEVGAIHRVVPGLSLAEGVERAGEAFTVTRAAEGEILLTDGRESYAVTAPDPARLEEAMPAGASPRWRTLSASVLDRLLISHLWGVSEDRVRVVHHDPEAAVRLARELDGVAAIVRPLDMDEVLAVAAGGEKVPRKSTSFGPKPRTGLVMRLLTAG